MSKRNKSSKVNPLLVVGAIAGTAAVIAAAKKIKDNNDKKSKIITYSEGFVESGDRQIYFVGGGLASLAGAVYLIRDCKVKGENIHIIESANILGGSNDGAGNTQNGFIVRGGRMLNEETYEN